MLNAADFLLHRHVREPHPLPELPQGPAVRVQKDDGLVHLRQLVIDDVLELRHAVIIHREDVRIESVLILDGLVVLDDFLVSSSIF